MYALACAYALVDMSPGVMLEFPRASHGVKPGACAQKRLTGHCVPNSLYNVGDSQIIFVPVYSQGKAIPKVPGGLRYQG